MKGLVRGGILVSLLSVIAIYAQTTTESDLVIADGMNSQAVAQTNVDNTNYLSQDFNNQAIDTSLTPGGDDDDKDTKLVKKTGMVTAGGMGASKGSFSASAYCFSGRTAMGHGVYPLLVGKCRKMRKNVVGERQLCGCRKACRFRHDVVERNDIANEGRKFWRPDEQPGRAFDRDIPTLDGYADAYRTIAGVVMPAVVVSILRQRPCTRPRGRYAMPAEDEQSSRRVGA